MRYSRHYRVITLCFICLIISVGALYLFILSGLPNGDEIENFKPESTVRQGRVNWNVAPESPVRVWVPIKDISPWLQKAVVISEDDLFFQHKGVNFDAMKEAFKINWQKKRYVRGASTITMQLARNAFLHKRKTLLRKIREIIVARRIEENLSKTRILELYLNIVEWGENIFGAEAAARFYFGKSAEDLNLSEAALLAGMLPNPRYFNPYTRPESCKRMQRRVLWLMEIAREVTQEQALAAKSVTTSLRGQALFEHAISIDSIEEAKYILPMTEDSRSAIVESLQSFSPDWPVQEDTSIVQDSSISKMPDGMASSSDSLKEAVKP